MGDCCDCCLDLEGVSENVGETWRVAVAEKGRFGCSLQGSSFFLFTETDCKSCQLTPAPKSVRAQLASHGTRYSHPHPSHPSRPCDEDRLPFSPISRNSSMGVLESLVYSPLPPWLALPPLEAISRTSSLGLDPHCQHPKPYVYGMNNLPVGKVAGVGVV